MQDFGNNSQNITLPLIGAVFWSNLTFILFFLSVNKRNILKHIHIYMYINTAQTVDIFYLINKWNHYDWLATYLRTSVCIYIYKYIFFIYNMSMV